MALPTEFGTVYLGEQLSMLLCAANESPSEVFLTSARITITTPSQRVAVLRDTDAQPPSSQQQQQQQQQTSFQPVKISAGSSHEIVVHHEVKEIGTYTLTCAFQSALSPEHGERTVMRKNIYNFTVRNPLNMRTKITSTPHGANVLLELHIQNIMAESNTAICFERIRFEPTKSFECIDVASNVFADDKFTYAGDSRQYLFYLTPSTKWKATAAPQQPQQPPTSPTSPTSPTQPSQTDLTPEEKMDNLLTNRDAPGLGRIDIVWRSSTGSIGRLQTGLLSRRVLSSAERPVYEVISAELGTTSGVVRVNQPFTVNVRIRFNRSQQTIAAGGTIPNEIVIVGGSGASASSSLPPSSPSKVPDRNGGNSNNNSAGEARVPTESAIRWVGPNKRSAIYNPAEKLYFAQLSFVGLNVGHHVVGGITITSKEVTTSKVATSHDGSGLDAGAAAVTAGAVTVSEADTSSESVLVEYLTDVNVRRS
ncbi:hypothetical protein GQ42DRAFT_161505 [Ramicandelaber brevisporus]|nr:hypothetical protein GQ42DRAFT_161505 [Ramicandelaber brevisporus]